MAEGKYEMKDNSFSLFKNKDKKSDKSPDYSGDIMINGKKLKLAAWIKESRSGDKYMNGSVSEPQEGGRKREDDF